MFPVLRRIQQQGHRLKAEFPVLQLEDRETVAHSRTVCGEMKETPEKKEREQGKVIWGEYEQSIIRV